MKDGQAILDALPAKTDQNDAIHAARKAIRRMRALLALVVADDLDLDREDFALRRLGKGLSDMRDAHVVVETARRLQSLHPDPGWQPIIEALELRRTRILQRSLAVDPGFLKRRNVIERVLDRIGAQPWETLRKRTIRAALASSERRAKRAAERAAHHDDPEIVHRWRRKVRRLRMQLDAAQELGAIHGHGDEHAAVARKALHKISDRLGWSQDVRLLRNLVRNMPASEGKQAVMRLMDRELPAVGD
ncbi:CHAD domain-containing protein [uncultured Stenotrophomonas sp.]|uniref:CHAD domain-containing protein n=1 Tax=uncultured Stenotrophomonas sp. TaxID=165438 RepID=UPI0028EDEC6D|nr:CHAD domain-containing protein [uncultured Stenotrophomonas sp.]